MKTYRKCVQLNTYNKRLTRLDKKGINNIFIKRAYFTESSLNNEELKISSSCFAVISFVDWMFFPFSNSSSKSATYVHKLSR
jgi:hypothetical protein